MRVTVLLAGAAWAVAAAAPASAQTAADHVKAGIAAQAAIKPDEALKHYQAALASDSTHFEANWRGAVAAIEVAQQPSSATTTVTPSGPTADAEGEEGAEPPAPRTLADSMYTLAEAYARRALEADGKQAAGHFAVAYVLGSRSLVSDPLTRLGMAREIWQQASDAIAIDPKHDGAHHILGQWYAEIMRLSDFERGYADGEISDLTEKASWDVALEHLAKATEIAPTMIYHRLDLARAYRDAGRESDAKAQVEKIATLPVAYPKDEEYKEKAKTLLDAPAADAAESSE